MSNQTTDTQPIVLTEGATAEIIRLMQTDEVKPGMALRVGVKGGGCAGLSYVLGFDQKQSEDEEYEVNGIRIFMNPAHELYLHGIEIDYQRGLGNRGFVFTNPNAQETCGCGTSFA